MKTIEKYEALKKALEKARNDSGAIFYAGNVTNLYKRQTYGKKEN